jgi:hypothetical protein
MRYIGRIDDARIHEEVTALIPWYVNGSLGEHERERLDTHLPLCANCRDAVAQEQRIYRGVSAEPAVEYMPAASLKRLQARLDALDATASGTAPAAIPAADAQRRRSMPWQGLMAASVAVMAVALSWLAADRWTQSRTRAPNYFTVTTAAPHVPGEVIRAVFSPAITLTELQAILDAAQLRIVAGPTEAGVYSLAANSRRPVSSSLALLRQHSEVRFAESTQPGTGSGDTP